MLYVAAAGAITPLGLDVDRTVASLRSGLDRFQEMPFAGQTGEDVKASRVAGYLEGVGGIDRYESLALRAIVPCLVGLSDAQRASTAVLIGLPRVGRPGVPDDMLASLLQRLASKLGLQPRAIHGVQHGRVSVHELLAQSAGLLHNDRLAACIVGGVDTLVNANSLTGLAEAGEIKEEWDGFIPGEAAAFVRVQREAPNHGVWGNAPPAVRGIGLAREPASGIAADPLIGVGLCAAYRLALKESGLHEKAIGLHLNDVNGNRVAFEDAGMAFVRFFRSPRDYLETWHVASHLGETGAAVGALQLIWACAALELGFSPGAAVLLSASDADLRSAVLLHGHAGLPASRGHRLQAGMGVPALHRPQVGIAAPMPDAGLRLQGEALGAALASENFSELSWLFETREGHHRGHHPWLGIADFERRLLTHLDALMWSGELGRALAQSALESDEASEVSAAAWVLLSQVPDSDSLKRLGHALHSPGPQRDGVLAVLPHLPSEAGEPLFRASSLSVDRALRTAMLRAASLSGRVDEAAIAEQFAASPEALAPELIHAIASAGLHAWAEPACRLVEANPSIAITGVNRVALLCIAPAGAAPHFLAAQTLARSMPVALALACLRDDLSFAMLADTQRPSNPATLEAWGWSGEQEGVPVLLEALQSGEPAAKRAAANALFRIYGIACFEEVAVPPDDPDEPTAATHTIKQLSRDPQRWMAELRSFGRQSPGVGRLRHGKPWSPSSALQHLKRAECAHAERLVAAWEHAVVHRAALPCQPIWFIGRQLHALSLRAPSATP